MSKKGEITKTPGDPQLKSLKPFPCNAFFKTFSLYLHKKWLEESIHTQITVSERSR